jgi:hypothetical protein
MKNKPQTIADLKINWNFNFETYLDYKNFEEHFRNRNPSLKDYNIVNNRYYFYIIENSGELDRFSIKTSEVTFNKHCSLFELMFDIDHKIACCLFSKPCNYSYLLERFEKVTEDQYDIILRKVEK